MRENFNTGAVTINQHQPTKPDLNGHVNNVEYLRWMQDAAMQHSEASGCTQATSATGATWVVRTHKIEYLKPAFAGDHVVVCTWVANFRRVQSLRKYKIFRPADKALLAEGETDWVFVDAQKGFAAFHSQGSQGCI